MNCVHRRECLNSSLCHLCQNGSLLKVRKPRAARQGPRKGASAEKRVLKKSQALGAKPQPASGSLWGRPGDHVTEEMLIEVKDQAQSARGREAFTLKREWLEDAARKAAFLRLGMFCLPFSFRDDDEVYAVVRYRELCNLLLALRELK